MNVRYRAELSQVERDQLQALVSGGKHAARQLKRAQILLAADAGVSDEVIATSIAVIPLWRWLRRRLPPVPTIQVIRHSDEKASDHKKTMARVAMEAVPIREEAEYEGVRVRTTATIAGARIPIQSDVGFGDAITPAPVEIDYAVLLNPPAPHLEAAMADKLPSGRLAFIPLARRRP